VISNAYVRSADRFKCGEGVPERTKGYFTSHLVAVSKILHVCCPLLTFRKTFSSLLRRVIMSKLQLDPIAILHRKALSKKSQTPLAQNTQQAALPLCHRVDLHLQQLPSQPSILLVHQELPGSIPWRVCAQNPATMMETLMRMAGAKMHLQLRDHNLKRLRLHINRQRSTWRN
jgi:hypothetical protein